MKLDSNNRSGILPASGTLTQSGLDLSIPATITLTSSNAGRLIELSTDGTNYFTPVYDATMTGMINVVIEAPVRNIRLTGAVSDPWSFL